MSDEKRPRGRPRKIKTPEPEPEPEELTFDSMTLQDLKKIALAFNATMDIPGVKNMSKADLIDTLEKYIEIEDGQYVKLKSDFNAHDEFEDKYAEYQGRVPVKRSLTALEAERIKLGKDRLPLVYELKTMREEIKRYDERDEPELWESLNEKIEKLTKAIKPIDKRIAEIQDRIKELKK